MDFLARLKEFIAKCTEDPSIVMDPQLDFLKDFISNLGGEVPEAEGKEINEWFDLFKRSTIVCPSSGHTILEPKFLLNGTESRYGTYFEEDCHLGSGGFGSVFKCKGLLDHQVYAVKKVCMKNIAFEKALREVRALSSLTHPNIVKYYQAWVEPQLYVLPKNNGEEKECDDDEDDEYDECEEQIEAPWLYILMEFCPLTLYDHLWYLVKNNVYNRARGCDWFRQIVTAVEFIHRNGFLHGDLSLKNIFLDETENVRLGDFGQSRKMEEEGLLLSNEFGMGLYKAPELIEGATIDHKVDMFSLGVIMGELLYPFESRHERDAILSKLKEAVLSGLEEVLPNTWADMKGKDVIKKLFSKNPADRPTATMLLEGVLKMNN